MDMIEKAIIVASKAHDGQYRKLTNIPYITHPLGVGLLLIKINAREELVVAGILHDTVEDTEITLEDIKNGFSEEVAELVEGCSEPDKSLPWEARKEHTISFLRTASEDTRTVVCADKLHNIRSIIRDYRDQGEQVWRRFSRGKEKQEWYYRNVTDSLGYASTFPLLEELKKEVDRLFG
ncbi:HD domain-containing protein [Bacillus sp. REN16]|uniref:HD domain-containing protein n=1 Tax=Bacillus sp. REN16 TaxID=2887296 RepID=UPI001E524A02|nr:HD domain-containing protein [Bacillus sp. REN16]MCC3358529.1 HD domain-containing protein [Bacillus sp. REN16]